MAVTFNDNYIDIDSSVLTLVSQATADSEKTFSVSNSFFPSITISSNVGLVSSVVGIASGLSTNISGSVITISTISGSAKSLKVRASGSIGVANRISVSKRAISSKVSASIVKPNTINFSNSALDFTLIGDLDLGTVVISNPYTDSEVAGISGNNYIIVNLKTKAHSNYVDGDNIALAKSCGLGFGSNSLKNVSDAYLLSRSDADSSVYVWTDEATLRKYPVTYGEADQAQIRNKKKQLAKGIRGVSWQIGVVADENTKLDVRKIAVKVNTSERRIP